MKWHPFSLTFPLLEGEEYQAFKDGIRAKRSIKRNPIFYRVLPDGSKEGLDGRNREKVCDECGIDKTMAEVKVSNDDVIDFIIEQNLRRRHMDAASRKAIVKQLSQQGDSTRIIAEKVGTSQGTVARDLEGSTESNDSVDSAEQGKNGQVFCKDKKTRPATGHKKGGRKPKETGHPPTGPSDADETVIERKDALGHMVPEGCLEAFSILEKFEAMDSLCRQLQKGIDDISTLPGGEHLRRCLTPTGSEEKTINKHDALNQLKRDLKFRRPYSICPACKGKGGKSCKGCSGDKWVEKTTWDSFDDAMRANLA